MADPAELLGSFITTTAQNLDKTQTKRLAGAVLGAGATILTAQAKKLSSSSQDDQKQPPASSKETSRASVTAKSQTIAQKTQPAPRRAEDEETQEEKLFVTAEELEDELAAIGKEMDALRRFMFTARAEMRKLDGAMRHAHFRFCDLHAKLDEVQTKLDSA